MFIASSHKWHEFWAIKKDMNFKTFRKRICFLIALHFTKLWFMRKTLQISDLHLVEWVIAILYCFTVLLPGDHIRGLYFGCWSAMCGYNNLIKKPRDSFALHVYFLFEFSPVKCSLSLVSEVSTFCRIEWGRHGPQEPESLASSQIPLRREGTPMWTAFHIMN